MAFYKNHSLGRSNTRITVLEYCQRKYFFNYYTHAIKDVDVDLWLESLMVKNLKSMEMWMGEKNSSYIVRLSQTFEKQEDRGRICKYSKKDMTSIMTEEFNRSKNRDYGLGYDKENKFGLSEHYYGEDVDDRLQETIDRVLNNLDGFINSEWHDKIVRYFELAKNVFIENPKVPDYENMKVNVDRISELMNVNILASPDFGVIFDDNNYLIIDWKSGKEPVESEGISDQLKVYVLKMLLKRGKLEMGDLSIKAYEVYLPNMNVIGGDIVQDDIDDIINKIKQDVDYQKQFIQEQDVIENIPVPYKNFQITTSLKKCENCSFRKVCDILKNK